MEKEEGEKELERKTTRVCKHIHMHTEGHCSMKLLSSRSLDCKATWMESSDQSKVIEHSEGKILHWDKCGLNDKLNESSR